MAARVKRAMEKMQRVRGWCVDVTGVGRSDRADGLERGEYRGYYSLLLPSHHRTQVLPESLILSRARRLFYSDASS